MLDRVQRAIATGTSIRGMPVCRCPSRSEHRHQNLTKNRCSFITITSGNSACSARGRMLLDQFFRTKRSPALTESLRCGLASVADYERRMCETADSSVIDYCRGGAASERTVTHNRAAFDRLIIRPRCLQRIGGSRSLAVTSFGVSYRMPIGIAPVALQCLAHPEGEKAMARAARTYGVPFVLSVLSSVSIEELAEAVPRAPKWFQLYIFKDRELTECLVRRAEKARFRALVVCVDTPAPGLSRTERRNPLTLPAKVTCANFVPNGNASNGSNKAKSCSASVLDYVRSQLDPSLGWDAIRWLMSITTLPVIVKGILNRADALIAADIGVHGLIVSNSGGRQLDYAPAAIEVLPEIVNAVGSRVEVMLDSGVSQGTDAFKALAIGARMVFVGRAAVYGLAVNGQRGVEEVLDILKTELESTMLNAGCGTLADLTPQHVCHEVQLYYPSVADQLRRSWRGESFRSDRYRSRDRQSTTETFDGDTVQSVERDNVENVGIRVENASERVTFQQRSVDTATTDGQSCLEAKHVLPKLPSTVAPPPYRNVPLQLSVPRGIFRSNTNNLSKSGCPLEGKVKTARSVINRKEFSSRRLKSHSMQNLCAPESGNCIN